MLVFDIYISNGILKLEYYVKNISGMFVSDIYLLFLPDISKWNTNNLDVMDELFYSYQRLEKYLIYQNWIQK